MLHVTHPTTVCVTGAECLVTVNGSPAPMWEPIDLPADAVLDVGAAETAGLRTYVLVEGGLDVPSYLGSASTFTLGRFGGHGGRQLVAGDVLRASPAIGGRPAPVPIEVRPAMRSDWELAVTEGPHGAPEFFTRADIDTLWTRELPGALQLGPHRRATRRPAARVGPPGWGRGGTAPVEHPRHRVLRRSARLHRRHTDPARSRRTQPRRLRLPRHGGRRRPMETRAAAARRHGAVRPDPGGRRTVPDRSRKQQGRSVFRATSGRRRRRRRAGATVG